MPRKLGAKGRAKRRVSEYTLHPPLMFCEVPLGYNVHVMLPQTHSEVTLCGRKVRHASYVGLPTVRNICARCARISRKPDGLFVPYTVLQRVRTS